MILTQHFSGTLHQRPLSYMTYIHNHNYWQPRMPSVPNCALRSPRIHETFSTKKIIIWQNSWMRPGNMKLSKKKKYLTPLYTCYEIKREWIKITYRKTFGTYAVKLDLVCSHRMQGLKLSAECNECNFLNSEYGKSTSVSSFLCVGLM